MEKYNGLSEITKNILHADLLNLVINYENDHFVDVHIEYKDDVYFYDYELGIDKESHTSEFIHHICIGHGAETVLKRNIEFEKAVEDYLFHQ